MARVGSQFASRLNDRNGCRTFPSFFSFFNAAVEDGFKYHDLVTDGNGREIVSLPIINVIRTGTVLFKELDG